MHLLLLLLLTLQCTATCQVQIVNKTLCNQPTDRPTDQVKAMKFYETLVSYLTYLSLYVSFALFFF